MSHDQSSFTGRVRKAENAYAPTWTRDVTRKYRTRVATGNRVWRDAYPIDWWAHMSTLAAPGPLLSSRR